ncbi:hypothetical protein CCACVL1_27785 [Corchorus capsularis]|uniref:RNase H type-1 domain-containing protein n=1 Tax=Corchorus capsularis TaxID=210143 RepID=A0A1R3G8P6_COCAP|nr:hypothetical protein CCACVL1_27785 [Corchorus capsularis]
MAATISFPAITPHVKSRHQCFRHENYGHKIYRIRCNEERNPGIEVAAQNNLRLGLDGSGAIDRTTVVETIKDDFERSYFVTGIRKDVCMDPMVGPLVSHTCKLLVFQNGIEPAGRVWLRASNMGFASAGDLIRDSNGVWIRGFAMNIGITNSLSAELWGLLEGLCLAKSLNLSNVIVHMDVSVMVNFLNQGITRTHLNSVLESLVLTEPPPWLLHLIEHDIDGIAIRRL